MRILERKNILGFTIITIIVVSVALVYYDPLHLIEGPSLGDIKTHIVTVSLPSTENVLNHIITISINGVCTILEPVGSIYDNVADGYLYNIDQDLLELELTVTIDENTLTDVFPVKDSKYVDIGTMSVGIRINLVLVD